MAEKNKNQKKVITKPETPSSNHKLYGVENVELPKSTKVYAGVEELKNQLRRHAPHLKIKTQAFIIPGKNKATAQKFLKQEFPESAYRVLYTDETKSFCRVWRLK